MRGHHIYTITWTPTIGEVLTCERETSNTADRYAVAVLRRGTVVGHVSRKISAQRRYDGVYFPIFALSCAVYVLYLLRPDATVSATSWACATPAFTSFTSFSVREETFLGKDGKKYHSSAMAWIKLRLHAVGM